VQRRGYLAWHLNGSPAAYSSRIGGLLHGLTCPSGDRIRRMRLELTDAELATAATACRAMVYRGPIESTARRYEKLEAARKRAD
jgi:hypothetical protein